MGTRSEGAGLRFGIGFGRPGGGMRVLGLGAGGGIRDDEAGFGGGGIDGFVNVGGAILDVDWRLVGFEVSWDFLVVLGPSSSLSLSENEGTLSFV